MKKLFLILTILLFAAGNAPAQDATANKADIDRLKALVSEEKTIEGKVVGVHDGDTATVLDSENVQHKIRFNGIDAPELKQAFGNQSKKHLSDLIFGRNVTVKVSKRDKYNREVGVVYLEDKDVNYLQILFGYAWHYKKYESEQPEEDRKNYAEAETTARNSKRGLWADPNPTAPWSYRNGDDLAPELLGKIFGNKNSKVYHWQGCSGFAKLSEESRVIFNTAKEAEAAGYRAAKNCKNPPPSASTAEQPVPVVTSSDSGVEARPRTVSAATANPASSAAATIADEPARSSAAPASENGIGRGGRSSDGRNYIRGPRGGCYYINSAGKKTYVERSLCN